MNRKCILFVLLFYITPVFAEQSPLPDSTWFHINSQGKPVIQLYFFWSEKCPHCLEALPVVENLAATHDDISLHSLQLIGQQDNVRRYQYMAMKLGQPARAVPAFLFCNRMLTGFDSNNTPAQLRNEIARCRKHLAEFNNLDAFHVKEVENLQVVLPFIGALDTQEINSLPVITVVLAAIDAFNPCAFFVLMFLLSMMIHTRSRGRMLLVGLIFVFMSGLMYFLFMTAWLNLFRVIGHLGVITLIAGMVSVAIGVINIKDFYWLKKGVSLSMSGQARQSLFQRMRGLLGRASLSGTIMATIGLALFANLYEFLCTAGFPMVFTRILTLSDIANWQYYAYLLLYNVVYILPLLAIVLFFTWTVGARKLQESEGRRLKLVSGLMMLSLGLMLIVSPELLQNIVAAGAVLLLAIVISVILITVERKRGRRN